MMQCRSCGASVTQSFVDLGMSPLCESYLPAEKLNHMEPFYPLHVWVCGSCFLVQLEQYVSEGEIFTEYAYFSSFAASWVKHAEDYAVAMIDRLKLGPRSFVVELASNDGYLLQHFVKRGVPCLGIEPAANVAKAAVEKGVETLVKFFDDKLGAGLAAEGKQADLIAGNNVLAQVPDVNSFVAGIHHLLKPGGVATLEFPHLQRLMEQNQFDTIYHEHFSYFSLLAVENIFERNGLSLFDVEELWTHGGSLRIYAGRKDGVRRAPSERLLALRRREEELGFRKLETYRAFEEKVRATKRRLLQLLIGLKDQGKRVVGYGAPGKGNTLLNYCGIRSDLLEFTVDKNPYKQGKFLPGTHVPIHPPEKIAKARPDYILILPWNFKDEILAQLAGAREWGARFIVPIPEPAVVQ
ncbi:MAG TPA: class I SAM-dependent methyltransferase [Myxococcales bacterium]|nr:class I SAM-dependent methyltransferase [Myxococcales bacterium]